MSILVRQSKGDILADYPKIEENGGLHMKMTETSKEEETKENEKGGEKMEQPKEHIHRSDDGCSRLEYCPSEKEEKSHETSTSCDPKPNCVNDIDDTKADVALKGDLVLDFPGRDRNKGSIQETLVGIRQQDRNNISKDEIQSTIQSVQKRKVDHTKLEEDCSCSLKSNDDDDISYEDASDGCEAGEFAVSFEDINEKGKFVDVALENSSSDHSDNKKKVSTSVPLKKLWDRLIPEDKEGTNKSLLESRDSQDSLNRESTKVKKEGLSSNNIYPSPVTTDNCRDTIQSDSVSHNVTSNGMGEASQASGLVNMFKSFQQRRLRARTQIDPETLTEEEISKLHGDIRNEKSGMRPMNTKTIKGKDERNESDKIIEGIDNLKTAALAPGTFINKLIDPEDGEENLGFYRHVALTGDNGFDMNDKYMKPMKLNEEQQSFADFFEDFDDEEDLDDGYRVVGSGKQETETEIATAEINYKNKQLEAKVQELTKKVENLESTLEDKEEERKMWAKTALALQEQLNELKEDINNSSFTP